MRDPVTDTQDDTLHTPIISQDAWMDSRKGSRHSITPSADFKGGIWHKV